MNYHVFFTTKYTDSCLEYGLFGATSVNSLGNVKNGDIAFVFDGLRWKIYGPLNITSDTQYYDNYPIYGENKRGIIRYPYRVSFDVSNAHELLLNKLFAVERNYTSESYLLNRTIISIMLANKQVHSTPLTSMEGEYLKDILIRLGNSYTCKNCQDYEISGKSVIDYIISQRKPKTEAIFELLLLENRHNCLISELDKSRSKLYNQFILGIQRQVDILSIGDNIALIELKKKDNNSNPYEQLREYKDYALSDYRLKIFRKRQIKLIAILEVGNKYLTVSNTKNYTDITILKFNMTKDYILDIRNA